MQRRPHAQKAAVSQLQQHQRTRQTGQPGQPAPAGQALPHGHKGPGAVQPRAVSALHVKARQQRGAIRSEIAVAADFGAMGSDTLQTVVMDRATDVDKAQAAVAASLGQAFDMGDFAPAQRAFAVVQHLQHFG